MIRLLLLVLAACSRVTTDRPPPDAAPPDAFRFPDALPDAPPDAYARQPCDAPVPFYDGLVPSRVLHVAPNAIHGDGSAAAPFGSIAAAAAVATPGTFIQLAPGLHATDQFVPNLRGTAQAPIWIGGAPGTLPAIAFGVEGLHLTRPAYVVVQNLELRNQSTNGINIDDGVNLAGDTHHVALANVLVHDIQSTLEDACVRAAGVDNLLIYDSNIRHCGVGIDLVGVHDSVVARNVVFDVSFASIQARGGSTDIDIRQNRLRDSSVTGISLGGVSPLSWFRPPLSTTTPNADARRIRAFDNVVTGDAYVPFAFIGCMDCLVAHNLTYGTPGQLVRILQGTAPQGSYGFEQTGNGRVINNSFVWLDMLFDAHVVASPFTAPTTFTFSHNLWYAPNNPSMSTPTLPVVETGSVIGAGTGYRPTSPVVFCTGPEANAATPLPEVDGTIEGYCRVAGDSPTIGPQMAVLSACDI